MSTSAPAFQWYPKDILASLRVAEMTLEEEGAYRRALDLCWLHGSLPADPERCARAIGKGASVLIARVVLEMFVPDPTNIDRVIHERLETERQKQNEWRKKSAKGGKASAGKRKTRKGETLEQGGSQMVPTKTQPTPQPNGNQTATLLSSSSLKTSTNVEGETPPTESLEDQTESPKKRSSRKDEKDPRAQHPAIQTVRGLMERYPEKVLWDRIIKRFGEDFDKDKLENCRVAWIERGYNKDATTWLNWYFDGIPERNIQNNYRKTEATLPTAAEMLQTQTLHPIAPPK